MLDKLAIPCGRAGRSAHSHRSRLVSIALQTGRPFVASERAGVAQGGIGMKLRLIVLMLMSLLTAACCDRVACTDVPASSYNNDNGGA